MGEATPGSSPQGRCADAAGPSPEGARPRTPPQMPRGARPRTPRASAYGGRPAPRVRRSRSRHGCGGHSGATGAGRPHQHVRFSCSYSVPGTSSACFVQQTPIGRHQESHCGGEAPSRLAKPLVSFCSLREFPRAAHLSPRRMSTYRSLLRKSAVFGNQMRIRVPYRGASCAKDGACLKKLANSNAPNGGLGMLDGAVPTPVGCFAFWLSGKSLMGSGIVRQSGHE